MALVFPAELGRTVVADQVARLAGILALLDVCLCSVELHRLGILERRNMHDRLEVLMEGGAAHVDHARQIFHREWFVQIVVNVGNSL